MSFNWNTYPKQVQTVISSLTDEITGILKHKLTGIYVHGSLALGGFHPYHSDIDLIGVTNTSIREEEAKELAKLLLYFSNNPYPVEISFLTEKQLTNWRHPCPFELHYSEYWRDAFTKENTEYLNGKNLKDPDIAAHITILNKYGYCLKGRPIKEVFPEVPRGHYLSSILNDYNDCLADNTNPIYSVLNILRVYCFLKEGRIISKQQAGEWALNILPIQFHLIVRLAAAHYKGLRQSNKFNDNELIKFNNFVNEKVKTLLQKEDDHDIFKGNLSKK